MEEANKKAAVAILHHRNNGHPDNYLDLHGLHVTEALDAFHARLQILEKGKKEVAFEVIPGAGHHSKDKAVLKPKLIEELNRLKLRFEEKNAGSLVVFVNDGSRQSSAPHIGTSDDKSNEKKSFWQKIFCCFC